MTSHDELQFSYSFVRAQEAKSRPEKNSVPPASLAIENLQD
jgi:hypothetical protein